MARHETLAAAMAAGDVLAEAEMRYKLLAETFEEMPQLRANINAQLERAKAEIIRLRALAEASKPAGKDDSTVVAFDATRFRKSGA
ncbi:hypothetical protein QSJ19_01535 [Gordonia sp. ABSL11-1]|uniref:hypothetical protein n=1 Tax=Gordonia sp. ABSL11-1 TaxID=3053924 RepID=UPI002572650D|nr:hypothetical protein [Gordonia sp. ABSL11-1]MDL9944285.1 hypothetical protein [Gordonia sp. ABSL11-1]